eukprot:3640491-Prymnesium_polylepis.1
MVGTLEGKDVGSTIAGRWFQPAALVTFLQDMRQDGAEPFGSQVQKLERLPVELCLHVSEKHVKWLGRSARQPVTGRP